jgi:membrane protein implicated in regulation of membrane protease activity
MVALGLILLVLTGLLTAGVVLSNTDPVAASAFGVSLPNVSVGGLFLAGAVTGLLFGLALAMVLAASSRKRARRRGLKEQVQSVHNERESLAEENARLQSELKQERSGSASAHDVYPPEGRHAADDSRQAKHGLFGR